MAMRRLSSDPTVVNLFLSLAVKSVEPQSYAEALLSLEVNKSRFGCGSVLLAYGWIFLFQTALLLTFKSLLSRRIHLVFFRHRNATFPDHITEIVGGGVAFRVDQEHL